MNKGISKAIGEWFYFIGSGDVFENKNVLDQIFNKNISIDVSLISGKIIYEGKNKPFIYSNNKMIKNPSWNIFMWIRNGLHHQGTFYRKEIFTDNKYSLKYSIFSDYRLNLLLFNKKYKCILTDVLVAKCNSDGVSKKGDWSSYYEEIIFKTELSSRLLKPFFYVLVAMKYFLRKIK